MSLPLEETAFSSDRVLRQLISALLFEGIVQAIEELIDGVPHLRWSLGGNDFCGLCKIGVFGRVRVAPQSIKVRRSNGTWELASLGDIVPFLPGNGINRGKLLHELQQTVAFSNWNQQNLPAKNRRRMAFRELDGALDEGHPYHPCYRARLGFSTIDHILYSPESGRPFQLVWLLIARKHLSQNLPMADEPFWRNELGDNAWVALEQRRIAFKLSLDDFGYVPMHPWQWKTLRDHELVPWITAGELHYLGLFGDSYIATQSVRSLFSIDRTGASSIKLPLNIINTSSRRTLEPHSVCTAPALSHWISGVVAGDALFTDTYPLTILKEYAGIIADPEGPLAGQIGALWRENAEATLLPEEALIPLNATMMIEADGKPFVSEWIERFGLEDWTSRLLEIVILPIWHLLVFHGIAVEAHGQNVLLVHKNGWPVRIILRDLHESVEFSYAFLRRPQDAPDFQSLNPIYRNAQPDQYYWVESVEPLRELVMDTLFVFNLTEVSHLLHTSYDFSECDFWARARGLLTNYADTHEMHARQALLDTESDTIATESLLTRKLLADKPEYHHRIPNDLSLTPQTIRDTHDPH
ncbi:rhizobactin siderophore biosynthesis protein RhsF [Rhizobium sp. CFBP 8762]|uniref:IucA/IucC family protein n=1 Tax=Rhizobium sp. CFBP 8762 TaxID=2775279 RepID=UPI00177B3F1C|nr:IucA/IucC family protein [Rhizobium sp. CFBP 8762]MBD8555372.1 rhizobactin siderophore biosynthesis protein RhsF [Rhizobium sp. CFBP 8762]